MPEKEMVVHRGGCHCGSVRFEVTAPADLIVSECNCSICSKSGYLGLTVPARYFRLLEPRDDSGALTALTTYRFNTGNAKHTFCPVCGIKSFYYPRSHPDGVNVNARCLDPGTVASFEVVPVDGRNWEALYTDGVEAPYRNHDG